MRGRDRGGNGGRVWGILSVLRGGGLIEGRGV